MLLAPLLAVVLTIPPAVTQASWKVTVLDVAVRRHPPEYDAWDPDGSGPDVTGAFQVGEMGAKSQCASDVSLAIPPHPDDFNPRIDLSASADASRTGVPCLQISLIDEDALDDTPIGTGTFLLKLGHQRVTVGSAKANILVERIASTTVRPAALPRGPLTTQVFKITIASAKVSATRADSSSWDAPDDKEPVAIEALAGLVGVGLSLGMPAAGAPLVPVFVKAFRDYNAASAGAAHEAQRAEAPEPRAVVTWGNLVAYTPAVLNTYAPSWQTTVVIPEKTARESPLRIDVLEVDGDKEESIATGIFAANEVVEQQLARLRFGAVEELLLLIERGREGAQAAGGNFVARPGRDWTSTGITVAAGQTLAVSAAGLTCMANGRCMGPAGDPDPLTHRNVAGAADVHEGELCALVGDRVYRIGSEATIVTQTSGELALGIATEGLGTGSITASVAFYPYQQGKSPSVPSEAGASPSLAGPP